MAETDLLLAILDSLKEPILFADTNHFIRYMNPAAISHFGEGEDLTDRSLLEIHNENSQRIKIEFLETLRVGSEDECFIGEDEDKRKFMRAVRDKEGQLLGYYERHEPIES